MTEQSPLSRPLGLPERPLIPHSERDDASPPRKRPRTRAPLAAAFTMLAEPLSNTSPNAPVMSESHIESQTYRFAIEPLKRFRNATASIKRPQERTWQVR